MRLKGDCECVPLMKISNWFIVLGTNFFSFCFCCFPEIFAWSLLKMQKSVCFSFVFSPTRNLSHLWLMICERLCAVQFIEWLFNANFISPMERKIEKEHRSKVGIYISKCRCLCGMAELRLPKINHKIAKWCFGMSGRIDLTRNSWNTGQTRTNYVVHFTIHVKCLCFWQKHPHLPKRCVVLF